VAKANKSAVIQDTEKEFLDVFNQLCYSRSSWQVWADLVSAIACTLSNVTDRTQKHFEVREKEYAQCIKRLGSVEKPAEMFSIIVMALEDNPEQDFLGKLYMNLNLGSHWKGQFFTPYSVCTMMSQINLKNVDRKIDEQGYISICDPACGAGATLIAAANSLKSSKYNFQNHVIFVGQDVDRVVAQMCYIQLSLLGCAEYICIGNTLTNPLNGPVLFPRETEKQELWYEEITSSMSDSIVRFAVDVDGQCVGMAALHKIDYKNSNAGVDIKLITEFRGKGIGCRIVGMLEKYAFEELNLHVLISEVLEDNTASRNTFEKAGFTLDGILRNHIYKGGRYHGQCFY